MRELDKQEEIIVRALIRNPRLSDNSIYRIYGVPVKTVNRKRKKLEQDGLIIYYASLNMGLTGTGRFGARHLHLITFKLGITQEQIIKEIMEEPKVRTIFTEFIYESHISEIEGHTALAMIIEGKNDDEINSKFNGNIIPSLKNNHGEDSIVRVSTIRLGQQIRVFHNYLQMVNQKNGVIKREWGEEAIFVGQRREDLDSES